jgi:2-oxoglutarate ferredoxin oxidoreductase subunit alpha
MKTTILIGGKAGQGPNLLANLLSDTLIEDGYHVFNTRDYESVIRGGHNFNLVTFSDESVFSNESKIDILVCLDENTEKLHSKDLKKSGLVLKGSSENMFYAGKLFKLFCLPFQTLDNQLKKLGKKYDENIANAKKGYEDEKKSFCKLEKRKIKEIKLIGGSKGIADGAIESGIKFYYAYPMTPATPILFELAPRQLDVKDFHTIELESEIAVVMAGLGSASVGAKTMVGTSGGGFDLMTEGLSMACQAEIPLILYNASRPGPSTGVATYTGQGDLNMVLYSGHGESFRLVLVPGDPIECQEITNQAFYFSEKYKLPSIILSDKHLSESLYSMEGKPKLVKSENPTELIRYNSYEHNSTGEATENAEIIKQGFEKRIKKEKEIEKEANKFEMFKIYGKKDSKNLLVSYGSTKGAILDAIHNLDIKFIQILYLSPFPQEIEKEIKQAKKVLVVENNATSPFSDLIKQKICFSIEQKNKILKYDGRPFFSDELKQEIERRLG